MCDCKGKIIHFSHVYEHNHFGGTLGEKSIKKLKKHGHLSPVHIPRKTKNCHLNSNSYKPLFVAVSTVSLKAKSSIYIIQIRNTLALIKIF